jgi:hypothetical protein
LGEYGKHRPLVKAALFAGLCALAAPVDACRLALVLALDVSSSVDDAEDRLQRNGLAAALLAPEVQDAFFVNPDPVALYVFEWSGRGHQRTLIDWQMITTSVDLLDVAEQVSDSMRSQSGLPTAMGHALGHSAVALDRAPDCLFQTIDLAGDGVNNAGFGPRSVYATFPFDGIIVNGLVITGSDPAAQSYFETQVIRGPGAFVETALGFAEFEDAMRRKLVRELSAQIIGRVLTDTWTNG